MFACTFAAPSPKPMSMNSPDGKQESEIINSENVPSYESNKLPDPNAQSNNDDEPIKVIEIQVVPDQDE
jgi:hypothetical protein